MSRTTDNYSFCGKLAAAHLRRAFAASMAPQPSLVPPRRQQDHAGVQQTAPLAILGGLLRSAVALLNAVWAWLHARVEERREAQRGRRLRVLETVALGEKRFLAIVQVRDQEFLIGSSASGVSLLTCLPPGVAATTAAAGAIPETPSLSDIVSGPIGGAR